MGNLANATCYTEAVGTDVVRATTMSILTLVSPVISRGPGCSTALFSMQHVLDLSLTVHDRQGSGLRLSCGFRIPVVFSASKGTSAALKGEQWSLHRRFGSHVAETEAPQYVP